MPDVSQTQSFASLANIITRPADIFDPAKFATLVRYYANSGMEIVLTGNLGTPQELREKLRLKPSDFTICGFMASSPTKILHMKDIGRMVPEALGKLNAEHDLAMPLLNGGGNWRGPQPDADTSLMGEWAFGSTRNNQFARFVITQGLLGKEGLPLCNGVAVCLKQTSSNDTRLGTRTDGLIGNCYITEPGGLGTLVEWATQSTNTGISEECSMNKNILIDPLFQNPEDTSASPYWDEQIKMFKKMNHAGTINDKVAERINDNCLVYRPDAAIGPEQMTREITAIVLAVRAAAPTFNPLAGYTPVSPSLMKSHLIPLSPNSSIRRIFDNHPLKDRSWGDSMQFLSTHHRKSNAPRFKNIDINRSEKLSTKTTMVTILKL